MAHTQSCCKSSTEPFLGLRQRLVRARGRPLDACRRLRRVRPSADSGLRVGGSGWLRFLRSFPSEGLHPFPVEVGRGLLRYYEYLLSEKEQTLDFEMEQAGLGLNT